MINLKPVSSRIEEGVPDFKIIANPVDLDTLRISREYYNGGMIPVAVFTRSGIKYIVNHNSTRRTDVFNNTCSSPILVGAKEAFSINGAPYTNRPHGNTIMVKDTYTIDRRLSGGLYEYYKAALNAGSLKEGTAEFMFASTLVNQYMEETIAAREDRTRGARSAPVRILTVIIDYIIELNDINDGGFYYDSKTDVVFSICTAYCENAHPHFNNIISINCGIPNHEEVSGLYSSITIIDNEDRYKDRFLMIGKKTHKVSITTNMNKESGVYFTVYEKILNQEDLRIISEEFLTVDEARDKIGLYSTIEEALTDGDIKSKYEKEITELKQNFEKTKYENAKELIEREAILKAKEAIQRDTQFKMDERKAEIERESLELKNKMDSIKGYREDYYSERSTVRKDNSEIIKYLPSIIAGVLAIWLVIEKIKK